MSLEIVATATAVASLLPSTTTVINLLTWKRGIPLRHRMGRISVLVPARNEEANIEVCLRAIAASRVPVHEVIVYDDRSSDATAAIVRRLQRELSNLRLLEGVALPSGWVGKPHACHRLAAAATGDVLVFIDADVKVGAVGLGRLVSLLRDEPCVVSAVPLQRMESLTEKLVIPLLHLTYTSWLPLQLVELTDDTRLVAANGQLMAMRALDYAGLGGFEAVRHEIVDDVALCRHAKAQGLRVVFADGSRMASCRMYASPKQVWQGFSKNIYEGIGGSLVALAFVMALYVMAFVLPYVLLPYALIYGTMAMQAAAVVGVAANLFTRVLLALRFKHSLVSVLAHPVAVVALLVIALNSWRWARTGRLLWAGRVYPSRSKRLEALR